MAKKRKQTEPVPAKTGGEPALETDLLIDLRGLIQQARSGVAQAVNSAQVLLYWEIGRRIRTEILDEKRAEYGEQIVATVSTLLADPDCSVPSHAARCPDAGVVSRRGDTARRKRSPRRQRPRT